jgi:hypothetical protein
MPCDSCKNRRFGGTYRLRHQGDKNRQIRTNVNSISSQRASIAVTAHVVPSSPSLVTLMMEAIRSYKTSVQEPHGVTSQKTALFIVAAVKTEILPGKAIPVTSRGGL